MSMANPTQELCRKTVLVILKPETVTGCRYIADNWPGTGKYFYMSVHSVHVHCSLVSTVQGSTLRMQVHTGSAKAFAVILRTS